MVSVTDQEWLLIFCVMCAIILFVAAVFVIVYGLLFAMRSEDEHEVVRNARTIKKRNAPRKLCKRHLGEKNGKIVIELKDDPTGTTQTMSDTSVATEDSLPLTAVSTGWPPVSMHPVAAKASSSDVERHNDDLEPCCCLGRNEETFVFNVQENEDDVDVEPDEAPQVCLPVVSSPKTPESTMPEESGRQFVPPAPSALPGVSAQTFEAAEPETRESIRKAKVPGELPPLKKFTPPRSITPQRTPPVPRPWAPARSSNFGRTYWGRARGPSSVSSRSFNQRPRRPTDSTVQQPDFSFEK